ncbi:MAG: hypothetical protein AB7Q16_08880 [Vicinamibacterales bacterium]
MGAPRPVRLSYIVHVVLLPALLVGAMLAVNGRWYAAPLVEVGDEAAYGLQVERAKQFRELVGPYSRFDFNHPGPVASYYYAFTEPLLTPWPSPMGRHHVAQLLLNAAFLLMALHAIYVLSPRKSDTLLLAAALLFVLARSDLDADYLSKIWPPYLLIFPAVTLVTTMAGVAMGRLTLILPAALASIYMVHNHVSAATIVAPFWLVAGTLGVVARSKRPDARLTSVERMALGGAFVAVLVAAVPPLVDEWRHTPGNLSRLWAFFSSRPGASHGWGESLAFVGAFVARPIWPGAGHPERVLAVLMLVATLAAMVGPCCRRLLALQWLGVALLVFGATRVVGPLLDHVMLFTVAFVALGLFLALAGLRLGRPLVAWPLVVVAAGMAVGAGAVREEAAAPQPTEALLQAIDPQPGRTYELVWEEEGPHHEQWSMAASLALMMTRRGLAVCTPPAWWVMFGRDMSACPPDAERLTLYATALRPEPRRVHAASAGGTTVEWGPELP